MLKVVQDAGGSVTTVDEGASFDDFWTLWPAKIARKSAQQAFARLTASQKVAAIVGVWQWRRVWNTKAAIREDFWDYFPRASTWINGERWMDELPVDYRSSHASHVPVVGNVDATPKATEIPAHVREALAKLRKMQ